jgi:hypothetical protein
MLQRLWAWATRNRARASLYSGSALLALSAIHGYLVQFYVDARKHEGDEIEAAYLALKTGRVGGIIAMAMIVAGVWGIVRGRR